MNDHDTDIQLLEAQEVDLTRPPKQVSQPVNIQAQRSGDVLTITVDLSKSFGPTKGGNILVGSTRGSVEVGTIRGKKCWMGLNVYLK